jgi:hypothetical protein
MKHDGVARPFHGHGGTTGLSALPFTFFHQMNEAAWQKKLLKPSRIGKKGIDRLPIPFAFYQKPVEPSDKGGLNGMVE